MIYYKGLFFQVAKVGRDSGNVKKNGSIKKNDIAAMVLIRKNKKTSAGKKKLSTSIKFTGSRVKMRYSKLGAEKGSVFSFNKSYGLKKTGQNISFKKKKDWLNI